MPVIIRALRDGFRRAGMAHPAEAVEHPDDAFTADQLAALEAEPMLVVERRRARKPPAAATEAAPPHKDP